MLPGIHGFHWEAGHLIFVGLFLIVAIVIGATGLTAALRSGLNFRKKKAASIIWKHDFHDLPEAEKKCRHELDGLFQARICDRAFDCSSCPTHAKLLEKGAVAPSAPVGQETTAVAGLEVPLDRFYHRGHSWVQPQPDGTVTVGLDVFATAVFGRPDVVSFPKAGDHLQINGTAWRMTKNGREARVLSPVEGDVVETGCPDGEWYVRVRPQNELCANRQLLAGAEVAPWMNREFERLQVALSGATGPALADGGTVTENLAENCSKAEWDNACAALFLEP